MSATGMIEHAASRPFPASSLVAVEVPTTFNKVILAAASKNGLLYADQLLTWAIKGADCERQHEPKKTRAGRNRK